MTGGRNRGLTLGLCELFDGTAWGPGPALRDRRGSHTAHVVTLDDGGAAVLVNQQQTPGSFSADGASWYTLGVVDNAAKQGLAESQVQYVKGRREVGWNLAKDLGVTRAVQVDSLSQGRIGTADAVIIVGKDLAK